MALTHQRLGASRIVAEEASAPRRRHRNLDPPCIESSTLQEATITYEVAREVARLRLTHRDPADRFLVATAKVFDLTLVTADERLMNVREASVLANRESS